jgi:RNA polymerase sigma-70 factor (ECF subfamily)
MTAAASDALAAARVLETLARDDRGRLLSALMVRIRDVALAEEALQDAMLAALADWGRAGPPASPRGWILRAAYRKAIDRIRNGRAQARLAEGLVPLAGEEADDREPEAIPDERLRLIFTCCHPAIEPKSRVALTLRTLGGLSTAEIAAAFLDQEATMGQRLSRAKAKIAAARIPYRVPDESEWPERLRSVLAVIYLIFNAGYSVGPGAGRDLAEEALWLGALLDRLRPEDPEIEGFRALMLITNARRAARVDANGVSIPLGRQDRALWDRAAIAEGVALLERALARRRPGVHQIKAAIAACHCEGDISDWPQIAALYGALLEREPTAVVRLNRAVAIAEAGEPAAGFAELEGLSAELSGYQPFHAARAHLLAGQGRAAEARAAYARAIALARSAADVGFLAARLDALCG